MFCGKKNVELAGVEPASKQGIQKLTPCADTEVLSGRDYGR